jgi:hypothetical protein
MLVVPATALKVNAPTTALARVARRDATVASVILSGHVEQEARCGPRRRRPASRTSTARALLHVVTDWPGTNLTLTGLGVIFAGGLVEPCRSASHRERMISGGGSAQRPGVLGLAL